ncbi:MAG: hypothetical protein ACXWSC_03955 [Bdellovibrionota bacterium]
MKPLVLLSLFLLCGPAFADATRCEKLKAEAAELSALHPVACDESRQTHDTYVEAFPEIFQLYQRLEAQVAAGEPKLALGTEDEMHAEIMDLKAKHLTERRELADHVTLDLLITPVDNNDPRVIPPQVSSECGTEIETHVRYRRMVLRGISEFFAKIDEFDDALFAQAADRALPAPIAAPVKNVR